ncbi:MAG TPA: hypothetical protein VK961_15680 [Chthoniobacter sp.]|nr:hypothetical protein [Chthoniobacter sp.]
MILLGSGDPSFVDDAARYFAALLGIVVFAMIVCGFVWLGIRLASLPSHRDLIGKWCSAHGLRLAAMEKRWFWKGPFFFSPNGTVVFYVTAYDRSGTERHLWVRVGHWLFGILVPELRVSTAD